MVTWGSQDGAPYVSGVPVGRVDSVYSSLRETTQRAVIDAVRRLLRPRPGRRRGAVRAPRATAAVIERGREPAMTPAAHRCPRAWPRCVAVSVGAGAAGLGVPAPRRSRASSPTSCCSSWSRPGCAYGSELGLVLGFGAGLLLDLAPPADHSPAAGRSRCWWSGYVAGPARGRRAARAVSQWLPVGRGAASFVGTSVFALTGLLLRDPAVGVGELLRVEVLVASAWDVAARALVVVPLVLGLFARARARPGPGVTPAIDRREPQPAAAGGDPGAGLLAVRDAAGPALLPAGRHRRRVHRPGRLAVGPRDRRPAAARADRRRRGPAAGRQPHLVGGLDRPRHAGQAARGRAARAAAPGRAR